MADPTDTTSTNLNSRPPRGNTGAEEQAIRHAVIEWMHRDRQHGSDCRVIHELTFGERRVDLAFVYPADIVGVEIKGPRDSLGDGRLPAQMREYGFYIPEVWLAVDAKWWEHEQVKAHSYRGNILQWKDGVLTPPRHYNPKKPARDEMCCSRLLDLLWNDEVRDIANRMRLYQGHGRINSTQAGHLKNSMARLMTGHEIVHEVCTELRARPAHMVGRGSSEPMARPAQVTSGQRGRTLL